MFIIVLLCVQELCPHPVHVSSSNCTNFEAVTSSRLETLECLINCMFSDPGKVGNGKHQENVNSPHLFICHINEMIALSALLPISCYCSL